MRDEIDNDTEIETEIIYEYVSTSSRLSFKFWVIVILLCLFLGLCLYNATNSYGKVDPNQKEELGANVSIDYDKNTNKLSITDYAHVKDYIGRSSQVEKCFDFSVNVHLKQAKVVVYELSLKKDSTSNINDKDVHIYLEKKNPVTGNYEAVFEPQSFKLNDEETSIGTPKGNMLLNNTTVKDSGKEYYRLRMWLTDTSTVTYGNYSVEVLINAIGE